MTPRGLAARALLLLGAFALLSAVLYAARDVYVAALLPALGPIVDLLLPSGLARTAITLVATQNQHLIQLGAVLVAPLETTRTVVPAGETVNATTLAAYALQSPPLIYAIVLAWPAHHAGVRVGRILLGSLAVLATTLLDLPFVLAGLLHELVIESGATSNGSPALVLYYEFLHRGGRFGCAVAAGVAVCLISDSLFSHRARLGPAADGRSA